jgi:Flp pilus assembly protein TadD
MKTTRRSVLVLAMGLWAGTARAAPSADADDQALNADTDYVAGLAAIKAGDFNLALSRFQSALRRFPEAADLHNEIGYTHRKLRQMDRAFEHYKRALAIEPRHRGAHEYIGEAYLMVGDLANAEKHLAALRSICVLPCEELDELRNAIAQYQAKGGSR